MRAFLRTIRRRHEPIKPANITKLERWLGAQEVRQIARAFEDWFGPPVAMGSVPGNVYVTAGGGFVGDVALGSELTQMDMVESIVRREQRRRFFRAAHSRRQSGAFANLQAILDAANGGKKQYLPFEKAANAIATAGRAGDLWARGTYPAAGAAGAAAPGGTAPTNTSTGALPFVNPPTANSAHLLGMTLRADISGSNSNVLLVDQLFRVAKTMSSTTTEAVTGTFSRYQSSTATDGDYIGGNFCYPSVIATLGATAHNLTVCQYTNQAGTTGQSFPSTAGSGGAQTFTMDLPTARWFLPPASGDVGVKALTQMQLDASVTGTMDFVVAHPLGLISTVALALPTFVDCLTTATSQLSNIYDNACLNILSIVVSGTNATTLDGTVIVVSE